LHATFAYQPRSDTWRLTIDDVKDGKTDRFGAAMSISESRLATSSSEANRRRTNSLSSELLLQDVLAVQQRHLLPGV